MQTSITSSNSSDCTPKFYADTNHTIAKRKRQRKTRKQLALIASKPNYCPPISKKLECHQCKYFDRCVYTRNNQYTPEIYHENHRLSEYITEET